MGVDTEKGKNVVVNLCDEGIQRAVELGLLEEISPRKFSFTKKGHKRVDEFLTEEGNQWS